MKGLTSIFISLFAVAPALFCSDAPASEPISMSPESWRSSGAELLADGTIIGRDAKQNYGGISKKIKVDFDKTQILAIEISEPDSGWFAILAGKEIKNGYTHIQRDTRKEGLILLDISKICALSGEHELELKIGVVRLGSPDPVKDLTVRCTALSLEPRSESKASLQGKITKVSDETKPLFSCAEYSVFPDRIEGRSGSAGISSDGKYLLSDIDGILKKRIPDLPEGFPTIKTGAPLFDALYRLAVREAESNIRKQDSAFRAGASWGDVWTRDASFSQLLSLNMLFPENSAASYKVTVEDGEIVQDPRKANTGWPHQTDRMIWLLAAYDYFQIQGDEHFAKFAYDAGKKSMERALSEIYDPKTGLFMGESSFLDWAWQTYPSDMDRGEMGKCKALSTNCLYAESLQILSTLEKRFGSIEDSQRYSALGEKTLAGINKYLWLGDEIGYYGYFLYPQGQISRRSEGLGEALSVLFNIATDVRAEKVIYSTPATAYGVPCIYPQHKKQIPYHNLAAWPFVQAYFGWASARVRNENALLYSIATQMRNAAVFQTFKENINIVSGGTEQKINSDAQLWSIAGFLSIPFRCFLGMEFKDGSIALNPMLPKGFGESILISGVKYRKAVLDFEIAGSGCKADKIEMDGIPLKGNEIPSTIEGRHTIKITMGSETGKSTPGISLKTGNIFSPEPVIDLNVERKDSSLFMKWRESELAQEYIVMIDSKEAAKTKKTECFVDAPGHETATLNVIAVSEKGNASDAGKFIESKSGSK